MADDVQPSHASTDERVADLARAFDAVGVLITEVDAIQWTAPTPCTDWDVRRLVEHLIGMNRVFTAMLLDAPPPRKPPEGHTESDPVGAYHDTATALLAAFSQRGALDREYAGPLGSATGGNRLRIRLYDLLAHGWDLAQAMGRPADLPDDLAEQSLAFVREQLSDAARLGRFAPATEVSDDEPAIDRLAAFLGRPRAGDR
jgi:uncharacterized protein (TIGR03086 family)